jgi:hypothetical protein
MHFPSSPPEQRPLGNCTRLSVLIDSANKVKSWEETGMTQIETGTPGYLESKIVVWFGYYSNFYRLAHCIGSPRMRGVGAGDIGDASGVKT